MTRRTVWGGSRSLADAMVELEHWKDVVDWTRVPGPRHEDVWNCALARCVQPPVREWRMWVTSEISHACPTWLAEKEAADDLAQVARKREEVP